MVFKYNTIETYTARIDPVDLSSITGTGSTLEEALLDLENKIRMKLLEDRIDLLQGAPKDRVIFDPNTVEIRTLRKSFQSDELIYEIVDSEHLIFGFGDTLTEAAKNYQKQISDRITSLKRSFQVAETILYNGDSICFN